MTIHGDENHYHYPEVTEPHSWRFSVERIVIYICVTILIGMIIAGVL